MAKKVLIPHPIAKAGVDYLRDQGYDITMDTPTDTESIKKLIADADGMIIKYMPVTNEILACAKKLKVIGKHGIGLNNVDIPACTKYGVYLCNTPFAAVNAVAEHALMLMLYLARGVKFADAAVRGGEYHIYRDNHFVVELGDSTLTLMGLGKIGRLVAQKAHHGFGMKVKAYDPYVDPSEAEPFIELCPTGYEAIADADFVSLHMPLTPATEGMVDMDFLSRMKPSAYLINTARGALVNEKDVVCALTHGVIAGAGFDAFTVEPVAPDNPLCYLENVVLTPHFATYSAGGQERMALGAASAVHEGLSGKRPQYCVNDPATRK